MPEETTQIGLDDVLITQELAHRSPRTPNLQAETDALHTLARQLAEQSQTMLKTLLLLLLNFVGQEVLGSVYSKSRLMVKKFSAGWP